MYGNVVSGAYDELRANKAYDAVEAKLELTANEAVPCNDPVKPAVAITLPVTAKDPVIDADPENGNPTPWGWYTPIGTWSKNLAWAII